MLTIILGKDWKANSDLIFSKIASDVKNGKENRILLVPELISHETERRLCDSVGDTASRFAEVLSFSRLVRRMSEATGFAAPDCMDEGGRLIAMAAATRQLHSRLKAYAAVETRPEFLSALVDTLDEFKRCCISPEMLHDASKQSVGSLAQKLEELGLIYEAYDAICYRGKRDPRDQMHWVLEQLELSDFAETHTLYVDGFPDFTRQHLQILSHFIQFSSNVVIALTCDKPYSKNPAFESAGITTGELINAAKALNVPYEIVTMVEPKDALVNMAQTLFYGQISCSGAENRISLISADTISDECAEIAGRIRSLIRSGVRYRDIGIVCGNMDIYKAHIARVFENCQIPAYLSGTEDVLDKSVIQTVLSALEAVLSGLRLRDVLGYLKSAISPVSVDECDLLEDYALIWNIQGKAWLTPWDKHPKGLSSRWTERDRQLLDKLNDLRDLALEPLSGLQKAFSDANTLTQQVEALVRFLQDTKMAERLSKLADSMEEAGDNRNAQIHNQLWDILANGMEQLYDLLGDTAWDGESFLRLLKLVLGCYDVGTIPSMLDAVTVGSVSAMRCHGVKHVFVLGALEGAMPNYASTGGVLTDRERKALRALGVGLTGGAIEGLNIEFSEIYGVFTGATETITLSHPAGQPCYLYSRLKDKIGAEFNVSEPLGAVLSDRNIAGAYFAARRKRKEAEKIGLSKEYDYALSAAEHTLGDMQPGTAKALYGNTVHFSATKTDTYGKCRLAYFFKYGVQARIRKVAEIDPAEFGIFVHAVLEQLGKTVVEMGGFSKVSLEQIICLSREIAKGYVQEHFGVIDSQRTAYLLKKNEKQLDFIVTDWWEEMQCSKFQPVGFEVSFGDGKIFDAIEICGKDLRAKLEGFVDRIDLWEDNGRFYFRVVDYKTGKKAFDYCDVFNGMGLQMLLYLFALEETGESMLGSNPIPAGVLYFPARAEYISSANRLAEDVACLERTKRQKRSGLLLDDENVLLAMQPENVPNKLPVKKNKDGSLEGDLASAAQLKLLKRYLKMILEKMADDIVSGNICADPYTRGNNFDACEYCDFASVCCGKTLDERRDYRTITQEEFWYYVEKELKEHGR